MNYFSFFFLQVEIGEGGGVFQQNLKEQALSQMRLVVQQKLPYQIIKQCLTNLTNARHLFTINRETSDEQKKKKSLFSLIPGQ